MASEISLIAPEPSAKDYAYAIIKGLISIVPGAGGVAAEVLSLIVSSPVSKRQEEWFNSIAQGLVDLQGTIEGFRLDKLSENQYFVSTILQATQVALRNHQKEKLEVLRNAVLQSTLSSAPEDYYQQMFIRLVDELTPLHIEVLQLLMDMKDRYEKLPPEEKKDFVYDLADLQKFLGNLEISDVDFFSLFFKDLDNYRLANIHGLAKTGFHINFAMSRPTKLG